MSAEPRFVPVDELPEVRNKLIGRDVVYGIVARGELPAGIAVRVGRKLLVRSDWLAALGVEQERRRLAAVEVDPSPRRLRSA